MQTASMENYILLPLKQIQSKTICFVPLVTCLRPISCLRSYVVCGTGMVQASSEFSWMRKEKDLTSRWSSIEIYSLFKFRKPWFGSWWMYINVSVWRFTNYNAINLPYWKRKKKVLSPFTIMWSANLLHHRFPYKFEIPLLQRLFLSNTWTKKSLMSA